MQDEKLIEPNGAAVTGRCQLHAVLVRILDTGVLLIGESGIGKSECALDLITRGHQLIADDAVEVSASGGSLSGKAPALTSHLLEIRGLGIINVPEVFGENSVCENSSVDLCIELKRLVEATPLENAVSRYEVAGVQLPKLVLPVSPGRNLATLVETAVRLHRIGGTFATSERLIAEHTRMLNRIR
jgi:HPr kinase/phosphorylase